MNNESRTLHKVTIDGIRSEEDLLKFHGIKKQYFKAGEEVVFFLIKATDTRYFVESDCVCISLDQVTPGGFAYYSFTMPDADVEINISSESSMVNPMMNGDQKSTGPLAFFDMSKITSMNDAGRNLMPNMMPDSNYQAPSASEGGSSQSGKQDLFPWEGKPKFCTNCGESTYRSDRTCIMCKAELKPKS